MSPARPAYRRVPRNQRQRLSPNRRIGYDLMRTGGRYANTLYAIAATVGIARRRGVVPAFPSDYIYRRWLSIPDDWFVDDMAGVIPAHTLATHLPTMPRTYMQDLSLWADCRDEVMAALSPSRQAQEIIDSFWSSLVSELPRPICGVHVRRGDTVTRNPADSINPLPASYYLEAIERSGCASVFVVSDDHDWCMDQLASARPVMFSGGAPGPEQTEPDFLVRPRMDWVDLQVLALADLIVISNSSYSAWSAYKRREGVPVWAPGRWFGDRLLRQGNDASRFIQPEWTVVPVID